MNPVEYLKRVWLILIGATLILFAVGNIFFDLPSVIADSIQAAEFTSHAPQDSATSPVSTLSPVSSNPITSVNSSIPIVPQSTSSHVPSNLVSNQVPDLTTQFSERILSAGFVPDRITIPAVQIDAPIVVTQSRSVELKDQWFEQWLAPDEFAAGWQADSAPLGVPGNTVLSGHHNEYGKVFGHLVNLKVGDTIVLYSGQKSFTYQVTDTMILKERDVSLKIRQVNAQWISPTTDERITLVTCWPRRNNTHRLIVVAKPVDSIPSTPQSQ
jgi:LPXTG-site transpeptidase (sortase) family protein